MFGRLQSVTSKTKKRLLVAGGIVGGALLVAGALAIVAGPAKASSKANETVAPTATDTEIAAVVEAALVKETDPNILRQLASAMMVLPYSNPLHNKIGVLQERARELEAIRSSPQTSGTFVHLRQF